MATGCAAVLHRTQLHSTPLASLVHGHLHLLHALDRHFLLPDGVDGKRTQIVVVLSNYLRCRHCSEKKRMLVDKTAHLGCVSSNSKKTVGQKSALIATS